MSPAPVVDLRVWRVRHAAPALLRVARQQRLRAPGLRFARVLGTGTGRTFTPRDADPHTWSVVSVWDDAASAEAGAGRFAGPWDRAAVEGLRLRLRPVSSRGRWGGIEPFGRPTPVRGDDGPVVSLTRARLRPTRAREFWRSVPPVTADLHAAPGLRLTFGFGEAPVLLQGTFSLWESPRHLTDFAHRTAAHRAAVARTPQVGWYAEELFARLAVEDAAGSLRGVSP